MHRVCDVTGGGSVTAPGGAVSGRPIDARSRPSLRVGRAVILNRAWAHGEAISAAWRAARRDPWL